MLDGGILDPVPLAPTLDHPTDLTVAVNLTGPVDKRWGAALELPERPADDRGRVRRAVDGMLDALHERATAGDRSSVSMLDLAADVIDAMQGAIARMKLAAHPPDVEIAIPRNIARVLEFDRASELIEVGRRAAEEQLGPALERLG